MNKGLLTSLLFTMILTSWLGAQNPQGDLRIEMFDYYNLVVDHNIQTPSGASPRSVYIGVKICNDGDNDMTDVFAYIGDYTEGTPGYYPTVTPVGMPYSGTFSFTHEGGEKDATRYIGDLAAGECITQYWLLSYPLLDDNGNRVTGSKPDQTDDLMLSYDVWARANDGGSQLLANDSKTVQLRAEISAQANKIWPNTTSKVPSEFLAAFPDKELGWRQTTNESHPGSSVVLEGIWFDLGKIEKGFDNDGDFSPDFNFLLQPVGNPATYDANCFRLVKVRGLIVIRLTGNQTISFEFEDQMHFEGIPSNNTGAVGMVFYEFAVLDGPCSSELSPYQEVASGSNNEKHNGDYGIPGGNMFSLPPSLDLEIIAPVSADPGDQAEFTIVVENNNTIPVGLPEYGTPIVVQKTIPTGTYYVGGSAEVNNSPPAGTDVRVLYSRDGGQMWQRTEPVPSSDVTDIQWWLSRPMQPGETARVRYQLLIPADYPEPVLVSNTSVSTGNSDGFLTAGANTVLDGTFAISDRIFADDGEGNGVVGNGQQDGTEQGLPDVPVKIYNDLNNNATLDNDDVLIQEVLTDGNGDYQLSELADANYIVVVDFENAPLPQGWVNTTPVEYYVEDIVTVTPDITTGFAPLLEINNELVGGSTVYESDQVEFQVELKNLAYAEDTDNSSTVTAWASQVAAASNYVNNPSNLTGAPDNNVSWPDSWTNSAAVKDFSFGAQGSAIEKVELIISTYLDSPLTDDYLEVSFEKEDGSTVVVPDPGLSKESSPSLNDYVGSANAGLIVIDITQHQNWTWDIFDPEWTVMINGVKKKSPDGVLPHIDGVAVRVTSECCIEEGNGEPGNPYATVQTLPLTYEYNPGKLEFLSSSVTPVSVDEGIITFPDQGPLHPNATKNIDLEFRALQPENINSGDSVTTSATVLDAQNGDETNFSVSDESETFILKNKGSIAGVIFGDVDNDGWVGVSGYENGTDYFIPGVEVNLYGCVNNTGTLIYPAPDKKRTCTQSQNGGNWALIATSTTDDNGQYEIRGIDNGYYYLAVNESSMTGMISQTADPDQTSGLAGANGDSKWKDLSSKLKDGGIIGIGNDHTNVNFGYGLDEAISGNIWEDIDGDGTRNTVETTLSGVPVMLIDNNCTEGVDCPVVTTSGTGEFIFEGIDPGTEYVIKVDTSSVPGTASWIVTAEVDGTADNAVTRTLSTGEQSFFNNFGLNPTGQTDLSGNVYFDWHGNGHINSSDEGIQGVSLNLYRDINGDGLFQASDPLVQEIVTDINGNYQFSNLPEGDYIIVLEENTLPVFPKQTEDTDEAGICSVCDGIVAIPGVDGNTDLGGLDFGYELTGSGTATGTVYFDENGNGFANNNDAGMPDVEMRIEADMNGDGNFVWINTVTTDADGQYEFTGLPDGTYQVIVNASDSDIPTDYTGTPAQLTTPPSFLIGIEDQEVVTVNGVTCTGACDDELPAFGFAYPGIVASYIFYDENGNGTQDWNETGIPGVTVYICPAADGYCDATNALDNIETSYGVGIEPVGFYIFPGLMEGNYIVAVDESTLPAGVELTSDPSTDGLPCYDPLDPSDPNYDFLLASCDSKLENVSVNLGSQNTGPTFGYQPPGVIGSLVWFDDNEDGILDDTEPGLVEWEVQVRNISSVTRDGITYSAGEFTETTFTDFDGNYSFSNLPDGTWEVEIILPPDHVSTYDADGIADNLIQVVIDNGDITDAGNAWCASGQDCSMDISFGIVPDFTNTISGIVCLDSDEDGRCNTGSETFPTGTDLYIHDENGVFYGQAVVDNTGSFYFDGLPTANFVLSVLKTAAPLRLTSMTTSMGDTPAYEIEDFEDNAIQRVAVSGDVTDMHFGFTFSDTFDIGDLPAPYLTEVNGTISGPAHMVPAVPNLYLGNTVDAEVSSDPAEMGFGDDNSGVDDEDGVTFSDPATWTEGAAGGNVTVEVNGTGHLLAYADFNADGDFTDPGELIIDQAVTTGTYDIDFDIPAGTNLSGGQEYYVRFRLFENRPFSPSTAYAGIADNGEVEDYQVTICKNLTGPGTIVGTETGCNGFDPTAITENNAVEGGGGTVEYQWQESTDGGLNWTVIASANGASFDPAPITQTTRYRRGARRAKCNDFVYSAAIAKTVVTNYTDPGAIVGDEDNCGIYDPDIILNIIAPSGGQGTTTPYYQWQQSTDGGTTWNDIITANEEYYNPGVISQTTMYRRGCRKTPCLNYLYSNPVTKMVSVNYTSPGTIAGGESVCGTFDPTEITSVSLPAGGVDGYEVMQWQQSTNGGASWTDISGATGASYNPGVISQTTLYRRRARRTPCTVWVNSNVVTKTVKPFPAATITTYPLSASGYLCELTDYEFRAADAGANVTYDWSFGTYGNPATAAGQGPHYARFNVPNNVPLTAETVTLTTTRDGCVSTDNRVLTLRPEIIIDSIITQDPTQCQAQDGIMWIYATFPAGTSIEYSVNGGASWGPDYETNSLNAGVYDVRVRYQGGDCMEIYGNVALSDPPPQSTLLVSSSEECTDQTVVVEAIPINSNPVFTWTFSNGAVPNTASGPGPHSVYFTSGGYASIAVTMEENNCIGVRDTSISVVANFTDGGSVIGGETLCSTFDPVRIQAGSNPSGGVGGTLVYQWEYRESDGAGGWSAWSDVSGATSADYDPGIIAATTEFRRKARRAPCTEWVTSNNVIARLVQKPNLSDDTYNTVCPGFIHSDNVSDNDIDLVNPTYSLLVFPTNGTLDFEADGEFIYDPNSTFCGTDEFQYLVCNDGTGCCDTATVLVDLSDAEPPTILNVPADLTLSCDDQIPVADAVDVLENCQTVSIGTDEFITQGTDGCELTDYQLVRIWNGVDYCSNTAAAQQVISIEDKTSPDIFRIYTMPNGKKMVAGKMEKVSGHWKTVILPIQFATQPVVFTQVVTRNEPSPVIARLRNISTSQFQMKLQEEEGNDGIHAQEEVAWVAFEKGAFSGTDAFEVNTWLLSGNPDNNSFGQTYGTTPDFFATIQTHNEVDPATMRYGNLGTGGVDVWISEETSIDPETAHNLETVGYMAFNSQGNITNNSGEVIGEIGKIDLNHSVAQVNLTNRYHNPVVILGAVSTNDHDPVTVRVTNLGATNFNVQLEEWDYLDGMHSDEQISYMVIEGSLPLDQTLACDALPEALTIGTEIIAVDNCDPTIALTMTESDSTFNCQTDTTFTRTWHSVDDCGNVTELTQTFYLIDTEAPTFTVPPSVTILCGDDIDDLSVTGNVEDEYDNCDRNLNVVYADDESNLSSCNGYVLREWTATDACGNNTIKHQVIYISPQVDTDNDGVVDYFDLDDDNDGIADIIETFADLDQDGIPNNLDLDSDNDGIPDLIEISGVDINGDGIVDIVGSTGWDHDGDGYAFGYDGNDIDTMILASVTMDPYDSTNDRDGDGVPNFMDRDSDNDGIPDLIEVRGVDTDGDGVIDYPTMHDPSTMIDNDADGLADVYDPDYNNVSGIDDPKRPLIIFNGIVYKGGLTTDLPDFDGDGIPDYLDSDSDNDGISDLIESGGIDEDGDGRLELNAGFVDLNSDGMNDVYVTHPLITTEDDGTNGNGRPIDTNGNGTVFTIGDQDNDGYPNYLDYDSDNDNILDIVEVGLRSFDTDSDGKIDDWVDVDRNGFDDTVESMDYIFTEGEGATIDGRAEDSGDPDNTAYAGAMSDGAFAMTNGNPDIDDDADGLPNFLDIDSDNDLLPDDKEDVNGDLIMNEGETGIFNPDSDDDLIPDGIEDANRSGSFEVGETNPLDPDTDDDYLEDGSEDANQDGDVDAGESDPRDPCDPFLNEACRGIVLDLKVKLMGALIEENNTVLMRDDLRENAIIPTYEPYSMINHLTHIGEDHYDPFPDPDNTTQSTDQGPYYPDTQDDFNEFSEPGMIYVTGNDAPVDWVLVELRPASNPDSVVATRAGLLQRDGDVRGSDGVSYLTFRHVPSGSFHVSVRHRNHLGVCTASPYTLSPTVTTIDFTDPGLEVFGDNSRCNINGKMSLWAGDFNGDGHIIYQGPWNDILVLFQQIILDEGNTSELANFVRTGYSDADFNMDGSTIFQGPGNDKAKLLIHAVLASPENQLLLANFVLSQHLP